MGRPRKANTGAIALPAKTELVGLTLAVQPETDLRLPSHYTTEWHSWFLDQVRRLDFELSTALHDSQTEKPFTVSGLVGNLSAQGRSRLARADQTYAWTITVLSRPVVDWLRQWLTRPPTEIALRSGTWHIRGWQIFLPATTYADLLAMPAPDPPTVTLSFLSPTSFRRKGNHFPLPLPFNLFHSYLRRWNNFAHAPLDQDDFLAWVDEAVVILRYQIETQKVQAGKRGSVTGFVGTVQLGLTAAGRQHPDYGRYWLALGQLAPYCGTGHKTTFGLGQTRLGWGEATSPASQSPLETALAQRIAELTAIFLAQRQRPGGDRATRTAETWATVLARRELGESLQTIAADLDMPYATVKTYVKLARRSLRETPPPPS